MSYDYIIYCRPRSGSHLLATLLNSHPDIACFGETCDEGLEELRNTRGKIEGAIYFYHQERNLSKERKIIHLTRKPIDIATSEYIFNFTDRKKEDSPFRPENLYKERKIKQSLDSNFIAKKAEQISNITIAEKEKMKNMSNVLEISYEEMTDNQNIEILKQNIADKILDFLGVEKRQLSTKLIKAELN